MFMPRLIGALSSYVSNGKDNLSIPCIVLSVSVLLKDVNALCLNNNDVDNDY